MTPGSEIRRYVATDQPGAPVPHDQQFAAPAPSVTEQLSHRQWDELVDEVVVRIERRVLAELERRGRRYHPEVF